MTEKEKMQQQMLYDANYDTELIRERQRAKDLCYQFNQLRPSDEANQQQILSQLLGKKSDNCCILAPFWCRRRSGNPVLILCWGVVFYCCSLPCKVVSPAWLKSLF